MTVLDEEVDLKLTKDLREAASSLTPGEVRFFVDLYYQIQRYRISTDNMVRATTAESEPSGLLSWFSTRLNSFEARIPPVMKRYVTGRRDGRWCIGIHGIGPVLAAGLLSHIDIEQAPTVGHIWSFAGLNPDMKWEKGQRRPFSASMKTLCWKVGQSFMKLRSGENDIYGKVYEQRKAIEIEKNEAGAHAGYELRLATGKKIVDKLPPFIIDARARRWAVKLFLSHLHHVMYEVRYEKLPPKPYILTKPEHVHFIGPPQWPCE